MRKLIDPNELEYMQMTAYRGQRLSEGEDCKDRGRTVNDMTPSETKNLSWKDAWWYLLQGKHIKRPLWEGYWAWEQNTIMMHCRDGSVMDIRYTEFPAYTFSNIAQRDWMVVEDDSESVFPNEIEEAIRNSIMC